MDTDLSVNLLKCITKGKLEIKENNKESMQFSIEDGKITINLIDLSFNVPSSIGILSKISEAREFAKKLKEKNITLCISHKDNVILKLGKDANPKLSNLVTKSKEVEITNLRELRRLDKRLRQK